MRASSVLVLSSVAVAAVSGFHANAFPPILTSKSKYWTVQKSILFSSNANTEGENSNETLVNGSKEMVQPQKTLFENFDEAGMRLKPMAMSARDKAANFTYSEAPIQKIFFTMKACLLIASFLMYRSYRGLFVILPAIFRNVYDKLENSVGVDFLDEDKDSKMDIDPQTGKLRFRTRVVVSLLASVVTVSYMISGASKVVTRFYKTITSTSDVEKSFEAAADEVIKNEKTILGNLSASDKPKSDDGANRFNVRGKLFS